MQVPPSAQEVVLNFQLIVAHQKHAGQVPHPNYKMFYPLWHGDRSVEWVVIGCKPDILWEKDCAFCVENAASNNVTCIPIEDRKGEQAFNLIFDEAEGVPSRAELDLLDSFPTNPQAEILVFDKIEPENIIGAICQSKPREIELINQYPDFEFLYHRADFSARKGWEHWQ